MSDKIETLQVKTGPLIKSLTCYLQRPVRGFTQIDLRERSPAGEACTSLQAIRLWSRKGDEKCSDREAGRHERLPQYSTQRLSLQRY